MSPVLIGAQTLGGAWMRIADEILTRGVEATYDAQPILESRLMTVTIAEPDTNDALIAELGDPAWLAWMHDNFTKLDRVRELGDAASYATRLLDYEGSGRDQVAWVIERMRADTTARSATITTFQPLTDTTYIPCVSLLDFWSPTADGAVDLVVYAHSLDFGKKAYGNLVELAALQQRVAGELGRPIGSLTIHVKTAHIYEPEYALMRGIVASTSVR